MVRGQISEEILLHKTMILEDYISLVKGGHERNLLCKESQQGNLPASVLALDGKEENFH